MVNSIMFSGAGCEAVTNSQGPSASTTSEPKKAFADTPPLAQLRNKSKSCEGNTSEVALEGAADGESVIDCEPQRLDSPSLPQGPKGPSEDPSADVRGDLLVELEVMPIAEEVAVQGEPAVVMPTQGQVLDGQDTGAEPVRSEVIVAVSELTQGLSASTGKDSQGAVESQELLYKEVSVVKAGPVQVGRSASTLEQPLSVAETTAPVQSEEVRGNPLRESEAPVVTTAQSDRYTGGGDAPAVMAGKQAVELGDADTNAVAQDKTPAPAVVTKQPVEVAEVQVAQRTTGDNANSSDLDRGQLREAISGTTGQDSTGALAQDEQVDAQESAAARLEEQVQRSPLASQEEVSKPQSEFVIDPQVGRSPVPAATSTEAVNTSDVPAASLKSPVQNVGEQILDSVHASVARGDKQVLVRLDPPELGSVTVRFQEQDGQITGVLEVSKDQIRQEVEQTLPQVLRGLQEAGVSVRRLDVVLADHSETDLGRESLSQDAWAQQQGSGQQDPRSAHSSAGRWSTWPAGPHDASETREASQTQTAVGPDRIDMLM